MKNKGFTLVEVLIGLSIATVAAVSIAYTIANTNKIADAGKKTFIATNLAHQGLELTRALRDDAWFENSTEWTDKISCGTNNPESFTLGTEFTRTVEINCDKAATDDDTDPEFIEVTSTVDWNAANGDQKSIELKEKLYNWYVAPTPKP